MFYALNHVKVHGIDVGGGRHKSLESTVRAATIEREITEAEAMAHVNALIEAGKLRLETANNGTRFLFVNS